MRTRRWTATAAAAGVVALGAAGCGSDAEAPREGVLVQDLTGDRSGAFDLDEVEAGESLTLRVEVARVLSPDSFVVPPEDTDGPPLLVLARDHDLAPRDVVQLGGIARVFDYEDLAREYDLAARSAYAGFDNEIVLVARVVDENLPLDDK